jgi:hypothetical protein
MMYLDAVNESRQKVKTHFFPVQVQLAKKGKRSSPLRPGRPDRFCVGFTRFARFEAKLCLVSNPKVSRQKVAFHFLASLF